jgi:hypothetical protein
MVKKFKYLRGRKRKTKREDILIVKHMDVNMKEVNR